MLITTDNGQVLSFSLMPNRLRFIIPSFHPYRRTCVRTTHAPLTLPVTVSTAESRTPTAPRQKDETATESPFPVNQRDPPPPSRWRARLPPERAGAPEEGPEPGPRPVEARAPRGGALRLAGRPRTRRRSDGRVPNPSHLARPRHSPPLLASRPPQTEPSMPPGARAHQVPDAAAERA